MPDAAPWNNNNDPWKNPHEYAPGSPEDRAMAKKGWWAEQEWDSWQQYDRAQWEAASWQTADNNGNGDQQSGDAKDEGNNKA
eukprot:6687990-Karenia_brevis.AAC.1